MDSSELRTRFLDYFKEKGHTIVPSSSLLPDDPSVLLTTAGMQQFKPYYTGAADPFRSPHPTLEGKPLGSKNAASIQKSFRTSDIDEVGDERHLTFFEMMGNFSFGGYFKEEAILYAKEFLDSLGVSIEYVTVFGGDKDVPRDEESVKIWEKYGFSAAKGNIKLCGREDNFWGPTGAEGPCGPTTEIYAGGIEIWNIVFNQYYCSKDKSLRPLDIFGVDTGMGLERLAMVSQKKDNVFQTDLFGCIFENLPQELPEKIQRIIADHSRAIVFLISDGVRPSNKEAGYVLRRLMRRIDVYQHLYKEKNIEFSKIYSAICKYYSAWYRLEESVAKAEVATENEKFKKALQEGMRQLDKLEKIDAQTAFYLYETFGIPYDIIKEIGGAKAKALAR